MAMVIVQRRRHLKVLIWSSHLSLGSYGWALSLWRTTSFNSYSFFLPLSIQSLKWLWITRWIKRRLKALIKGFRLNLGWHEMVYSLSHKTALQFSPTTSSVRIQSHGWLQIVIWCGRHMKTLILDSLSGHGSYRTGPGWPLLWRILFKS